MHVGEVGIGYGAVTIGGSGGTPPYHWSLGGGALPAGLSISAGGGAISGTPTAAGGFNFTVLLQDSAGQSAGVARSVTVVPYLTASGKCTQICNVELGCLTVCGSYTGLSGGVQPFQYQLTSGSAPFGTTLSGAALAGTFQECDCSYPLGYSFSVTITDAFGAAAKVTANYSVFQHIAFFGGNIPVNTQIPCFFTGAPSSAGCTAQFPYSGGSGTPTFQITAFTYSQTCSPAPVPPAACPPPPTPTVSVAGGLVTVSVASPGSPYINGWTGTLTIVLTDQSPCGPGVNCSTSPANVNITQLGG
jgi:hypothetical protein